MFQVDLVSLKIDALNIKDEQDPQPKNLLYQHSNVLSPEYQYDSVAEEMASTNSEAASTSSNWLVNGFPTGMNPSAFSSPCNETQNYYERLLETTGSKAKTCEKF